MGSHNMLLANKLYLHLGMGYTFTQFYNQLKQTVIDMNIYDEDHELCSWSYNGVMIFNTYSVSWTGHVDRGVLQEIENIKIDPCY